MNLRVRKIYAIQGPDGMADSFTPIKSLSFRLILTVVFAISAFAFGGSIPRVVPGGPFLSLIV